MTLGSLKTGIVLVQGIVLTALKKLSVQLLRVESDITNVIAGFEVLTAMEKVRTDDDDRPKQEIKITGATIFVNPYKDEEEAERKAAEEARLKVTF